MNDTTPECIEVYEWRRGQTRPQSDRKPRHDRIDTLALPPHGQLPNRGDVIHLHPPPRHSDEVSDEFPEDAIAYVVLEREFKWGPVLPSDDQDAPTRWVAMWILVRKLDDYTQPSHQQE